MLHGLLPPVQKDWSDEDEKQLGEEHLRGVRTHATAARLCRGAHHCETRLSGLNLPRRDFARRQLINEYNPADLLLEPFRDQGWHFRQCAGSPNMIWTTRNGERFSPAFKRSKKYRDIVASGMGDSY